MSESLDSVLRLSEQFFGEPLTADALWEMLSLHRCYGLLREVSCPAEKRELQRMNSALNTNNIRTRYRYCGPVFEALRQQKIPYAVHKGAVLSQVLYQNSFLRQSGDVDLLICREDADAVKGILFSEGFVQGRISEEGIVPFSRYELLYHAANTHQLAPFVKKTENPLCPYINVDVNTDLFWGESEKMADLSRVLAETQTVSVCDVSLQKMTAEYEFVALCLHHYKDMNSLYLLYNRGLPLGHLCDIYDYIHAAPLQADKLTKICEEMEVSPYVKACILLAIRIFGTDDSTEALLQGLEGPDLSNFFGLKAEEYRIWELPLSHRIFGNIRHYLDDILSPQEQEKIRLNNSIMNS